MGGVSRPYCGMGVNGETTLGKTKSATGSMTHLQWIRWLTFFFYHPELEVAVKYRGGNAGSPEAGLP